MEQNCNTFQHLINKSIDKNIEDKELASLQSHIKQCNKCKENLKELEITVSYLNDLQNILIPEEDQTFSNKIISRIQTENSSLKSIINLILKYAAGFIILSLTIILLLQQFNTNKISVINHNKIIESYAEDFNFFLEDNNDQTLAEVPVFNTLNPNSDGF